MADEVPKALIVTWNGNTLRVECPFCLRTHRHGFPAEQRAGNDVGTRQSHCYEHGGIYRPSFAHTSANYGCELDRDHLEFALMNDKGRCYDTAEPEPYRSLLPEFRRTAEEHDDDGVAEAFDRLNVEESEDDEPGPHAPTPNRLPQTAKEVKEDWLESPEQRRSVYIGACVRRDVRELRYLLDTYPDENFPSLTSHEGGNGILLAATEENGVETIELLREHGAALDQADHYGRTPLMEAALWGRLDAVRYLLSTEQVDVRAIDGNEMTALELALGSKRNREERSHRVGDVYREPNDADERRRRIKALLERSMGLNADLGAPRQPVESFFQRSDDGKMSICRPVQELLIPDNGPNKAFAELDRGGGYPLIRAMSGYTQLNWPNVLENELWTSRANYLRMGVGLENNLRLASHVEPQLIAYLLYHHSLYNIEDSDWELDGSDVNRLRTCAPEYTLQPTITVSKNHFCDSCRDFKVRLRANCPWLNIRFRFVGERIGGQVRVEEW